jgi:GT2 family glycosyltransferase
VVIGAAARTDALRAVGGFREWPMYEDWDLWLRVAKAGHSFVNCPEAVYLATFNENSRNRAPSQEAKLEAHRSIARANEVWVP